MCFVIGLLREYHSREIQTKNKSVCSNAETGIHSCCSLLLMDSCVPLIRWISGHRCYLSRHSEIAIVPRWMCHRPWSWADNTSRYLSDGAYVQQPSPFRKGEGATVNRLSKRTHLRNLRMMLALMLHLLWNSALIIQVCIQIYKLRVSSISVLFFKVTEQVRGCVAENHPHGRPILQKCPNPHIILKLTEPRRSGNR